LPLNEAFWHWAVAGGLVVNVTTTVLFLVLITQGQTIAALIVGYALSVPYNVVAAVGVWRSAERYPGPRHLAQAARIVAVVGMALISLV
jgi:hypothetical protein